MRSPIFGDDVHLFRPERFIEAGDEHRAEMYKTTELTFGTGRWQCAGKALAFMELNKIFFEVRLVASRVLSVMGIDLNTKLFRSFEFQLVNPSHPMDSTSYMLFSDKNLWVHVTESEGAEDPEPKHGA